MSQSPYAKVLMSIGGGGNVSGGQNIVGNQTVQLTGENTSHWNNQLWEIYEYPVGFTVPSGWTNINGVYQHSSLVPDVFTVLDLTTWGKYLFRLTVNGGLLNGLYAGPDSVQPLVDIASGVQVLSQRGFHDICWQEKNQFDAVRQWIGELKATLRLLDKGRVGGLVTGSIQPYYTEGRTASATTITNGSYTMADETLCVFEVTVTCTRRTAVTKAGVYKRLVAYRRTGGGAPTIVGALLTPTADQETTGGDDVTIDVSGNAVRTRFTSADSDPRNIITEMIVRESLAV